MWRALPDRANRGEAPSGRVHAPFAGLLDEAANTVSRTGVRLRPIRVSMVGDYTEWQALVLCLVGGVVGGLLGSTPVLVGRWLKNEPLWPKKRDKITSPNVFYAGIVMFGGMGALSML